LSSSSSNLPLLILSVILLSVEETCNYHPCTISCGDVTAEPHQLKPLLSRSLVST